MSFTEWYEDDETLGLFAQAYPELAAGIPVRAYHEGRHWHIDPDHADGNEPQDLTLQDCAGTWCDDCTELIYNQEAPYTGPNIWRYRTIALLLSALEEKSPPGEDVIHRTLRHLRNLGYCLDQYHDRHYPDQEEEIFRPLLERTAAAQEKHQRYLRQSGLLEELTTQCAHRLGGRPEDFDLSPVLYAVEGHHTSRIYSVLSAQALRRGGMLLVGRANLLLVQELQSELQGVPGSRFQQVIAPDNDSVLETAAMLLEPHGSPPEGTEMPVHSFLYQALQSARRLHQDD